MARRLGIWIKRGFFGLVIAIATLLGAGLVYQLIATAQDHRRFPPPGQLVDVVGFKMHIHCTGAVTPAVILESLSGGFSSYWGWIQPAVAATTQVCSYDRAGRVWSEADPQPQSLARTSDNLRRLLRGAGVPGPYVLVGHSIGGVYVRRFAADNPNDVAGVVLVDSAHPEQLERYPQLRRENRNYLRFNRVLAVLARLGIGHLYFAAGGTFDFGELPEQERAELAAAWSSPAYFASQRTEIMATPNMFTEARKLGRLGELPLIVVTRGKNLDDHWMTLQDDLVTLSNNVDRVQVPSATHASLAFSPTDAKFVSDAILQLVAAARTGQPSQ
jgi:pimeloyl-ACP methyl ester carboxylesterase